MTVQYWFDASLAIALIEGLTICSRACSVTLRFAQRRDGGSEIVLLCEESSQRPAFWCVISIDPGKQ